MHRCLVRTAGRKALPSIDRLTQSAPVCFQQQLRHAAPTRCILRNGAQRAWIVTPHGHRGRIIQALRRAVHQRRQRRNILPSQSLARAQQDPSDQQPQIFVEMPTHARQLRLVNRARRPQAPREQRQPAVAARQHLGDESHQLAPTLIVELEHPINGESELVTALVCQGTARCLLIGGRRIGLDTQPGRPRPRQSAIDWRARN